MAAELAALVIAHELEVLKDELKLRIIGIWGEPRELVKPIDGAVGATLGDRSEPDEAP